MFRSLLIFWGGIFAVIPFLLAQEQGTLVLIGGNSEIQGGWSDIPYQWAINQSENRKVAIITYERETPWIQEYFLSLGANDVQHFRILSKEIANLDWMYDSLMNYDVLFLTGEKTELHFPVLKHSAVGEAIKDKFASGGVICGSSAGMNMLGNVVFSSSKGKIQSADLLQEINHSSVQLEDGLADLYDGFLFDNHFSEKGRGGRLLGLMANWTLNQEDQIAGIGVDDKTAFCIDRDGIGRVFGTGAVHIYLNDLNEAEFRLRQGKPVIDSLRIIQLLENDAFDMVSWEAFSPASKVVPIQEEESGEYVLLMSGSDPLSENNELLHSFVYEHGSPTDPILIVSAPDNPIAGAVQAILLAKEATHVQVVSTSASNLDNQTVKEKIEEANKFLFVGNHSDSLFDFLHAYGSNGDLLNNRLRETDMVIAFMGDDSRLAGKRYIDNYQEIWASYDGILHCKEGIGLLKTTIVMPNTYLDPDYVENTLSGVPYCMVKDSLAYGMWIGQHTFATYFPEDGVSYLKSSGKLPVMLLKNAGTPAHLAPEYGGTARNIAGFQQMYLSLIDSAAIAVGHPKTIAAAEVPLTRGDWLSVYPNPVKDNLNIFLYGSQTGTFTFQLIDGQGKSFLNRKQVISPTTQTIQIPIPNLPHGVYVLQVRKENEPVVHTVQVIR